MSIFVIDTNVLITANGCSSHTDQRCRGASAKFLVDVQDEKYKVALDIGWDILGEYQRNVGKPGQQPGVGDKFFKWLHQNRHNEKHVKLVDTSILQESELANLVDGIDPADCRFVIVAFCAQPKAEIVNATDSDWSKKKTLATLKRAGISVKELCPPQ